jgi:hypothetical protein
MNLKAFQESVAEDSPPAGLTSALEALWYDAKGDWNTAHQRAQGEDHRANARVHAYLHRKEGDLSNAAYWYRRAGQAQSSESLASEWEQLVRDLLSQSDSVEPPTTP